MDAFSPTKGVIPTIPPMVDLTTPVLVTPFFSKSFIN